MKIKTNISVKTKIKINSAKAPQVKTEKEKMQSTKQNS